MVTDPSIKESGLPSHMAHAFGQKSFGNFLNFGNLGQLSLLKRKSYKCGFCYIYHYHITRCDFFLLIHTLPTVTDKREIFSMTFHGGERFLSLISLLCH